MSREEQLAVVVQLACLTEDRAGSEQRALLDTALRLEAKRSAFTSVGERPQPPWLTRYVEETYRPSEGRRVELTTAQRQKLERIESSWDECAKCGLPRGAHFAQGCPTDYALSFQEGQ